MIVSVFDKMTTAVAAITTAIFTNLSTTVAPIAPAAIFGFAVAEAVEWMGGNMSMAVGFAAALALEGVGFSAFHIALEIKAWWAKIPAIAYLVIGIAALIFIKGGDAVLGIIMFALVALAYATDSMRRKVRETKALEKSTKEAESAAQLAEVAAAREVARLESEAERELRKAKLEAQKQVRLAEINAKLSAPAPETFRKLSETFPTDWRKLTDAHKTQLAQMTEQEIAEMVGVTTKTARAWLGKLA